MDQFRSLENKKILVTGHTGFKGAWLCKYLEIIGVEVFGYALAPEATSLYTSLVGLDQQHEKLGDINDYGNYLEFVEKVNPDIVIHMAAQSLVRNSYLEPVTTYQTNVMGTINVINASLKADNLKGLLAITTDKVYLNNEEGIPFQENDPKGGNDPYSGSKAAMEIAIDSWRYFYNQRNVGLVSARAGNVIGFGDISKDRLLPDIVRNLKSQKKIEVRNPQSIRPWQHVLEPLTGYLLIASRLLSGKRTSRSYNLGPAAESHLTVLQVAQEAAKLWGADQEIHFQVSENSIPEAKNLMLNSELAQRELNWNSKLSAQESIRLTIEGEILSSNSSPESIIKTQIKNYLEAL